MIQCGLLKFLKVFYSLQTAFRPLKFTAACSLAAPGCRGGSQLGTQYGYGMAIQLAKWLQSLEPPWPNIVTHPVRYQETFQNDSIRNHNFPTSQLPNYHYRQKLWQSSETSHNTIRHFRHLRLSLHRLHWWSGWWWFKHSSMDWFNVIGSTIPNSTIFMGTLQ